MLIKMDYYTRLCFFIFAVFLFLYFSDYFGSFGVIFFACVIVLSYDEFCSSENQVNERRQLPITRQATLNRPTNNSNRHRQGCQNLTNSNCSRDRFGSNKHDHKSELNRKNKTPNRTNSGTNRVDRKRSDKSSRSGRTNKNNRGNGESSNDELSGYFQAVSDTNREIEAPKTAGINCGVGGGESRAAAGIEASNAANNTDNRSFEIVDERSKFGEQRAMADKMSGNFGNINKLVEEAELAIDNEDPATARKKIYAALVGAQNAKHQLLDLGNEQVLERDLAHWFGTCAVLLHTIGDCVMAARCFYTATVFDPHWTVEQHMEVSETLWELIMPQFQLKKILELFREMDHLSRLAEARRRWNVCLYITHDIMKRQRQLINMCSILMMRAPNDGNQLERTRRYANCHVELGYQKAAQQICMKILQDLTQYDDSKTFEIWARSLLIDDKPELALDKVKMALKYAETEEDKQTLTSLLKKIQDVLDSLQEAATDTNHEPDQTWLPASCRSNGTLKKAASTSSLAPTKTKKSKTRHRRPKPRDRSNEVDIQSASTSANSSRATSPCPRPNIVDNKHTATDTVVIYDKKSGKQHTETNTPDENKQRNMESRIGKRSRDSSFGSAGFSIADLSGSVTDMSLLTDSEDSGSEDESDNINMEEEIQEEQNIGEDEDTFYEQTCRRYHEQGRSYEDDLLAITDEKLMTEGIKLNMSYLHPYVSKENQGNRQTYYTSFLSQEVLTSKLLQRPDIYKRCTLQIEGSHVSYCYPVQASESGLLVEISGRSKAGQTFNDDEVVVELLDKKHESGDRRYGKVIGLTQRKRFENVKHPVFVCTLDDMETHLVRPLCKTVPKISILNKKIYQKFRKVKRYKVEIYTYDHLSETLADDPKIIDVNPGDRDTFVFLVALIHWSPRSIYPTGAVIRVLRHGDNIERGLSILNLKHKVPGLYGRDTYAVTEALIRRNQESYCEATGEGRVNLCQLTTFTIDPPGSQDLDDALSVEKIADGFRVGVHIADVSALVKKDDPVDIEAYSRGVTYYPKIRQPRHMLPEPLSSNLCSLLPHQQRRAISVFFLLDEGGKLKQMEGNNVQIRKSVIQSNQQLTYREAQDIINTRDDRSPIGRDILYLFDLARKIRKRRLGDAMFALDVETDDDLSEDSLMETLEAHYLVEEFMIMANQKVAEVLVRTYPDCTPIRCQQPPDKDKMGEFLKKDSIYINAVMRLQGKTICNAVQPNIENLREDRSDKCMMVPRALWDSFKSNPEKAMQYLKTDDLYPIQHIVYQHWIRIQERASYQCSERGNLSESKRHFSLNKCPYTHFTSPIRRYNDLVIHRLLHAHIDKKPSPYSKHEVEQICVHVNAAMNRAKDYEKGCRGLQKAIELKRTPEMIRCYVDEANDRGVSLCAPELKHVDTRQKQLAFNVLDMSRKPEVKEDTKTNYDMVTGFWRKRIYDTKGMSTQPPNRGNNVQSLVANPGVIFVPLNGWGRMLKCAMENRQDDLIRTMKNIQVRTAGTGLDDVSTESLDPLDIQPNTKFSLTFGHGQAINGQMSCVPQKGLLSPKLVLYNMTHNVKLCLQHMDDPVLHLSRYTTRPTSQDYKDSSTYVNTWLPILSMEAAVGAISNEESCIINNVQIRFDGERRGKFALHLGFCEIRNIEFSGVDDEDEPKPEPKSYDWLCLKYVPTNQTNLTNQPSNSLVQKSQKPIWVGHAEVTSVKKKVIKERPEDSKLTVQFVLHERCPPLPTEARKKGSTLSVEILCKSEVDRRTESYIKRLTSAEMSSVAVKIALNKDAMPKLDRGHAHLADLIERDLYIVTSDAAPLPKNNRKQQEAIDKALTNRFSLIQGPPGTGKSYTGIKLMCLFDKINYIKHQEGGKRHQVLFCGPSNKSVDLVARWMLSKLGEKMPKFLRVYGRSIEAMEFPIPGRTFLSRRSTHNLKADDRLKSISLHHLIRQKGAKNAAEINAYDKIFKDSNYAPNPALVKKYVHLIREGSIDMIRQYNVILCTTAVGSNPKVLEATSVFQVIVDEAGMCPEPQCLVPVLATKAEQVVLIGDHKQLRPIIMCREAAELGLDKSLFERYSENKRIPFTMLEQQYRMNPHICHFPSKQFYDNKLRTERGLWFWDIFVHGLWPVKKGTYGQGLDEIPHVLVHVEGEERVLTVSTEEGNEQSKSNQEEIDVVVNVYKYLIQHYKLYPYQINVMSQYNAQVSEIKKRLESENMKNYSVSTVVSSQGGEWDYVIFSTVRSIPSYKIEDTPTIGWCQQNLGFITDKNQINVALTRARKGIIIVGNKNLLQCDDVWKKLISYYESLGCIKTPQEFPPKNRSRQQKMEGNKKRTYERYGETIFERGQATSYEGPREGPRENDSWTQQRPRRGGRGRGNYRPQ